MRSACLALALVLLHFSAVLAEPAIAPRPAGAATGTAFLDRTRYLTRARREEEIRKELIAGNVPEFQRHFVPVTVTRTLSDGRAHTLVVRVLPDYLAIGSDANFVRIPMGSRTAQQIADAWHCALPTRRLVDAIWAAGTVKLSPIALPPSSIMTSNYYTGLHQKRVEAVRKSKPLGALTVGHKKDVVLSNRLNTAPLRVAIYGWHYLSGKPIQPLSTVHEYGYADYSHGVRLIDRNVTVDGVDMDLVDVYASTLLHPLVSDEGRMPSPRIPGMPVHVPE